jgi:hypothetical protein
VTLVIEDARMTVEQSRVLNSFNDIKEYWRGGMQAIGLGTIPGVMSFSNEVPVVEIFVLDMSKSCENRE